jgi:hypothetical protein
MVVPTLKNMTSSHPVFDVARDIILLPLLFVAGVLGWIASYLQTDTPVTRDASR